jgi:hypothetical protein
LENAAHFPMGHFYANYTQNPRRTPGFARRIQFSIRPTPVLKKLPRSSRKDAKAQRATNNIHLIFLPFFAPWRLCVRIEVCFVQGCRRKMGEQRTQNQYFIKELDVPNQSPLLPLCFLAPFSHLVLKNTQVIFSCKRQGYYNALAYCVDTIAVARSYIGKSFGG